MTRQALPGVCALAGLAVPLVPLAADAQSIAGSVVDAGTSEPVAAAEVTAVHAATGDSTRAITDEAGAFRMLVEESGTYRLAASRIGYAPLDSVTVRVSYAERVEVTLRMSTAAVRVDPLTVTGRGLDPRHAGTWEGFLARRDRRASVGSNLIMSAEDPEFSTAMDVGSMLNWLPPSRGGRCVNLFMDGREAGPGWNWNEVRKLGPGHFAGMEFYRRPLDAPMEYRSGGGCSILALWRHMPGRR